MASGGISTIEAAADDIDIQRKHINLLLVDGSLFGALTIFRSLLRPSLTERRRWHDFFIYGFARWTSSCDSNLFVLESQGFQSSFDNIVAKKVTKYL